MIILVRLSAVVIIIIIITSSSIVISSSIISSSSSNNDNNSTTNFDRGTEDDSLILTVRCMGRSVDPQLWRMGPGTKYVSKAPKGNGIGATGSKNWVLI